MEDNNTVESHNEHVSLPVWFGHSVPDVRVCEVSGGQSWLLESRHDGLLLLYLCRLIHEDGNHDILVV